jgi:hypothetical protein
MKRPSRFGLFQPPTLGLLRAVMVSAEPGSGREQEPLACGGPALGDGRGHRHDGVILSFVAVAAARLPGT